jgi:hypothetical protein
MKLTAEAGVSNCVLEKDCVQANQHSNKASKRYPWNKHENDNHDGFYNKETKMLSNGLYTEMCENYERLTSLDFDKLLA